MHPAALPEEVVARLRSRRAGRVHLFERLDAARCALVVVDMQATFVAPDAPSAVPSAREIVPNINRLAAGMRAAGGAVAWVQATYTSSGAGYWPGFFDWMVEPELAARILEGLRAGSPGHALWSELATQPGDIFSTKSRYSAFFPGACELPGMLRSRGIETVLIAGTMTNVCCEASARDAMMDGFRTLLVSDANAARSDAEHLATLCTVAQFFGDVRTTSEVLGLLK